MQKEISIIPDDGQSSLEGPSTSPYTAEISRVKPSCFVFLIDQSGSMAGPFAGGTKRKKDGVADVVNRFLQTITIRCARGEGIRDLFEVAVVGYGEAVGPAFGGVLAGRGMVPISQVARSPMRIESRTVKSEDGAGGVVEQIKKFPVWFDPVAGGGTPMPEALSQTYEMLQAWVAAHPDSYPPIVINITDAEAGGDLIDKARAIMSLSTANGQVLLFNCHISHLSAAPILYPDDAHGLPDDCARLLFEMSSLLPEPMRLAARNDGIDVAQGARGFAFNADLVELIRFLDIGTRSGNLR